MSAFQIWKAAKSALLIPWDFNIHRTAFAFVEKACSGKKEVIRALKMNSSKITGVSIPY